MKNNLNEYKDPIREQQEALDRIHESEQHYLATQGMARDAFNRGDFIGMVRIINEMGYGIKKF